MRLNQEHQFMIKQLVRTSKVSSHIDHELMFFLAYQLVIVIFSQLILGLLGKGETIFIYILLPFKYLPQCP